MTDQGEQASVCPTCGSDDPKKRYCTSCFRKFLRPFIHGAAMDICENKFHNSTAAHVAAPRDPQKLVDALGEAYVLLEGLRISVKWELAPSIKTAVAKWCQGAESALKEWEENQ